MVDIWIGMSLSTMRLCSSSLLCSKERQRKRVIFRVRDRANTGLDDCSFWRQYGGVRMHNRILVVCWLEMRSRVCFLWI